jgi:hypothetical protein
MGEFEMGLSNDEQWLLEQSLSDDEYDDWQQWHAQQGQAEEQERNEAGE